MRKRAYFASRMIDGWPRPQAIEGFFLGPPDKRWFSYTLDDTAGFNADGVDGTEHLESREGNNIRLALVAHPDLGVLLNWSKWDGSKQQRQTYHSKGDLSRLREFVSTRQNDPTPVGLFVPYETAWKAVKQFLETDGALPDSIEWLADRDLPPDAFP